MVAHSAAVPDFISLLERHQEEIATSWAEMVRQIPGSQYQQRSLDEIRASTLQGVGAVIEALKTGSYTALETYLNEVSLNRLQLGFSIGEVIEALLLFKDAIPDEIQRAYSQDPALMQEIVHEVDLCSRWMACRFAVLYADEANLRLKREQERMALMLETAKAASGSLDLNEVLGRVARSMASAVGVHHCGIYLVDEEKGYLIPIESAYHEVLGSDFDVSFRARQLDPNRDAFTAEVLESKAPVACTNAETDPRTDKEVVRLLGLKSILGVPFVVKDRVVAVAMVGTLDEQRAYSAAQVDLTWGIANTVALVIDNARLYRKEQERRRKAEQRRRVAESLRDILAVINSNHPLDEILDYIVSQASKLMGSGTDTAIYRYDYDARLSILEAACGLLPELMAAKTKPLVGAGPEAMLKRQPIAVPDLIEFFAANKPDGIELAPEHKAVVEALKKHYRGYLGVPLIVSDNVYGGMAFHFPQRREFSDEEISLAITLGNQAALAIENARLRTLAERSAVAAERSRLARDLHDAVTQTLFSASLIAEVLPRLWERDPEEGQRRLMELRELTRGALAEMRTLLLELRPAALADAVLGDLLRQLGESITGRARIPVAVEVEGECVLEPEVKVALYRIAQEALNNIAKHAGSSQASVNLRCQPGRVLLRVSDDGIGFDPQSIPPESLGLTIMRERAEAIGAALDIDSKVGHGTQVVVVWGDKGVEELL
ncbi:MAG: GAF domain-containing protein [Anaerolineales bacterium]